MSASLQPGLALQACGVAAALGGRAVLHEVSLGLQAGRWTSIVGPNGAGKSTLLKVLAGLLPHSGVVHLQGRPLSGYSGRERARQLAWLGLGDVSADEIRVYDLVMLGRLAHQAWLAGPAPADHEAVAHALGATHAWDWRLRAFGQLSGGERQRVLLARALAVQAKVLLMDEPLANLDPPHQTDWLLLVRQLVAQGSTVVSVLHEISMALQADEMLVLQGGRVLHQGPCDDAQTHAALEAVFERRIEIVRLRQQWLALPKI